MISSLAALRPTPVETKPPETVDEDEMRFPMPGSVAWGCGPPWLRPQEVERPMFGTSFFVVLGGWDGDGW